MKARLYKFWVVVLGLVGLVSCDKVRKHLNNEDDEPVICLYGIPYATFVAKGTVSNPDGQAINGIKVTPVQDEEPLAEGVFTDKEGKFECTFQTWPDPRDYKISFEDIDGEENLGSFAPAQREVTFKQVSEGTGAWNQGSYEATNIDVTLKLASATVQDDEEE